MLRTTARPSSATRAIGLFSLLLGGFAAAGAQAAPTFSQFIIFGDSLSDTGNDANVSNGDYGVTFPGEDFNYTTGRFTNGSDTNPASTVYTGVWHEELAKQFLGLPTSNASLNGGLDFAYGGATTEDGFQSLTPGSGIAKDLDVSITIENMGQQVTDYLSNNTVDPAALYIVWGGANDIFNDSSTTNAIAAADRETALINRLAQAGAVTFLVPNLPPLGATPNYNTDANTSAAVTQSATDFGTELNSDLDTLQANLTAAGLNVTIYRLDVFGLFNRLLAKQYAYGFTNITDSAQGNSVKADQYLFWDDVHPTVAGHYQLAAEAYTLLTGVPVVETNALPAGTETGSGALSIFYLTRTGTDLSAVLTVPYAEGGTAATGPDYAALKGSRVLKAGKQTAQIMVYAGTTPPVKPAKTLMLTLQPGDGYQLPLVPSAKVKLAPQPAQ